MNHHPSSFAARVRFKPVVLVVEDGAYSDAHKLNIELFQAAQVHHVNTHGGAQAWLEALDAGGHPRDAVMYRPDLVLSICHTAEQAKEAIALAREKAGSTQPLNFMLAAQGDALAAAQDSLEQEVHIPLKLVDMADFSAVRDALDTHFEHTPAAGRQL